MSAKLRQLDISFELSLQPCIPEVIGRGVFLDHRTPFSLPRGAELQKESAKTCLTEAMPVPKWIYCFYPCTKPATITWKQVWKQLPPNLVLAIHAILDLGQAGWNTWLEHNQLLQRQPPKDYLLYLPGLLHITTAYGVKMDDLLHAWAVTNVYGFAMRHSITRRIYGYGLFTWLASMNHSCSPNARVQFDGNVCIVTSIRAIPADQEITVSYVDQITFLDRPYRQLILYPLFDNRPCHCERCTNESPTDQLIEMMKQMDIKKQSEAPAFITEPKTKRIVETPDFWRQQTEACETVLIEVAKTHKLTELNVKRFRIREQLIDRYVNEDSNYEGAWTLIWKQWKFLRLLCRDRMLLSLHLKFIDSLLRVFCMLPRFNCIPNITKLPLGIPFAKDAVDKRNYHRLDMSDPLHGSSKKRDMIKEDDGDTKASASIATNNTSAKIGEVAFYRLLLDILEWIQAPIISLASYHHKHAIALFQKWKGKGPTTGKKPEKYNSPMFSHPSFTYVHPEFEQLLLTASIVCYIRLQVYDKTPKHDLLKCIVGTWLQQPGYMSDELLSGVPGYKDVLGSDFLSIHVPILMMMNPSH